ncbi:hypothetical protein [Desulfovibrio sp. ZJ200]|uniref:hypothetical protein n=1 Tax=Desulfovibrio sp. ZJ200 TaxID=2709792 RepID=UPI0013EABAD7|nr:hypothetical protein [Desulfovibrio sp. ZJ200]
MNSEKWNDLVDIFEQNKFSSEQQLQNIWETIFSEYFGYSRLKGDIDSKRTIQIGSTERIIPDIILKDNNSDLFIVELKKSQLHCGNEQLISYLKLLKVNVGILICDCIYVYSFDYTKNDAEQDFIKIDFIKNNKDGELFITMFSKTNFTEENIKQFINSKIQTKQNVLNIKKEINNDLLFNLLEKYFSNKYSTEEIKKAIETIEIIVTDNSGNDCSKKDKAVAIFQKSSFVPVGNDIGSKLSKDDICVLFQKNGINLHKPNDFTKASKNKSNNVYWANPNISVLEQDWELILNDWINKELHYFFIPANSIQLSELKVRSDNPDKINLNIQYKDQKYSDRGSNISFKKWHIKTIKYQI